MHQSSQGTEQIVGVKDCDAMLQRALRMISNKSAELIAVAGSFNKLGLGERNIEMMSCTIRIWFGSGDLTDCLSPCTEELWELSAASSSWEDRCCSQFSKIASKCHFAGLPYLHQNILWDFWDESYQSCTKVKVDNFGRHGVEWLTQDRKRARQRRGVTQPWIQIVQQPTTRTRKLNVSALQFHVLFLLLWRK